MLTERDIVSRVQHVTVTRLRVWVRQGWIRPAAKDRQGFSEADMARAALIRDLEDKLGFDEDQVLERAMNVFWALGYEGAGIADLEKATELGRQSLYGAFGSKRELFGRVVEFYF